MARQRKLMPGERAEYEPGKVEKAFLSQCRREYNEGRGIMQERYNLWGTIHLQMQGKYLRDPADPSDLANIYIPFVSQNIGILTRLLSQRLIPDAQTMDFVETPLSEYPEPSTLGQIASATGGDPADAAEETWRRVTARLRYELKRSEFFDFIRCSLDNWKTFGFALGYVDKKFCTVLVPREEVDMKELASGASLDEIGDDDVVLVGEQAFRKTARFMGFDFRLIHPFQLIVPSLESDNGVRGLRHFIVYGTKKFADFGPNYVNVECLLRADEKQVPLLGPDSEEMDKTDSERDIAALVRIGKVDWDSLFTPGDEPTENEWAEFEDKFDIEEGARYTDSDWLVEFTDEPTVLVRCEAIRLPYEAKRQDIVAEVRRWIVPGQTFAMGDFEAGAGQLEILANNALQGVQEAIDRTTRPMVAISIDDFDRKYLQELHGQNVLDYAADRVIKKNLNAQGPLIEYIMPPFQTIEAGMASLQFLLGRMERIQGVAEQFKGADAGAGSATESKAQQSYLEQQNYADMANYENNFLRPVLRSALAQMCEMIREKAVGGVLIGSGSGMDLWPDADPATKEAFKTITPEMADLEYGIEIRTVGSMGDLQTQVTRLQQSIGMADTLTKMQALPPGSVDGVKLMREYNRMNGIKFSFIRQMDQQQQMMAQQAMMQQGGNGKNPGGAGLPRPEYDRTAPEVPAPGEAMEGQVNLIQAQEAGRPTFGG